MNRDGRSSRASGLHEFDGGRAFYTALGHTEAPYADETFKAHLAGAINWAAGQK